MKYMSREMEVKAVEEEKEEVSGGKEDIKELKGRKQQTENWNVLYILVVFFFFLLRSFYLIKGSIIMMDL